MVGGKVKRIVVMSGVYLVGMLALNMVTYATDTTTGISGIATNVTTTFTSLAKLLISTAYLAGFGLTIASIFKFKQHKDNPQQVPMGIPITLLLVGVALIFLPSIIKPAGQSIFGANPTSGNIDGSGFSSLSS